MKRFAPVCCVLALIATKLWISWSHDRAAEANPIPRLRPTTTTTTSATTTTPTPTTTPTTTAAGPTLRRLADAAARARVMEAITTARARRFGTVPNLPAARPPVDGEPLMSAQDVQASFKAVVPLLADCYERALPRLAVRSGDIAVHMRATGEPDVGTLIDDATIDGGGGLLDDQELGECLHETLVSVELPPMPEGGVVEITYPISFQESGE